MKYQKPQIVAKSDAKKSYTAGCPAVTMYSEYCIGFNYSCEVGPKN